MYCIFCIRFKSCFPLQHNPHLTRSQHYNSKRGGAQQTQKYHFLEPEVFSCPCWGVGQGPYRGKKFWCWKKFSCTCVLQEPFRSGSQWYFKAEKLEKVFLCLVPRGCLLFCMFVLFSCLYFTLLKRDFLLFRPVYFCFSLQGVCGNVLNQLCFWKNHNVALKLGALSVSTYSVVFVPAWDACDTEIFSVCFSGGGLKT